MVVPASAPFLLTVGRKAVVKECRGPRSTSGLPLMGNKVMYLHFHGWGQNDGFIGVDTRKTESSVMPFRYCRASLMLVRT